MKIKRLRPTDASNYCELRLRGLLESPRSFSSSYAEESKRPQSETEARLAPRADTWALGSFVANQLVGIVSIVRFGNLKERHKAGIYGMYVAPEYRRLGVGRMLLDHAINRARRMNGVLQLQLGLNESNLAARHLYEKLGFKVYGREINAYKIDSEFHHELLMALEL